MRVEYLKALEDNYVYVCRYDGLKALVVDPGEAEPLLEYVSREGIEILRELFGGRHINQGYSTAPVARL